MFTQQAYADLAKTDSTTALTIYLPTHRAGEQTHNGHDAIAFKDALQDARKQLVEKAFLSEKDAEAFVAQLMPLVQNSEFWRHQSDTLAVFATADNYQTYSLPVPTSGTEIHVGERFALALATRMLAPEARYYVFAVTQNYNAFYEATRHSITPVYIADVVPTNMEEVLEIFEGGETLQHHSTTVTGAAGGTVFNGQGSNEDREDERLEIYFRRLNDGLEQLLEGQQEPLILVADGQHLSGLQEAIKYPNLVEGGIGKHPNSLDPTSLHAVTWEAIQDHFDKSAEQLASEVEDATGANRLATGIQTVLAAAIGGRVATLMLAEDVSDIRGTYDESTHTVQLSEDGEDLLERVTREVTKTDGKIIYRLREMLPESPDGVSAILRYTY